MENNGLWNLRRLKNHIIHMQTYKIHLEKYDLGEKSRLGENIPMYLGEASPSMDL